MFVLLKAPKGDATMKKFLFFALLVCTLCSLFCLCAAAETYEGKCGDNITFKYDPHTLTLTFSGEGELDPFEYTRPDLPPWRTENYSKEIKHVVIEEGITHIGNIFLAHGDIQSMSIPDSVISIHQDIFYYGFTDAPIYTQYGDADYIGNEQNPYLVLVRIHNNTGTHFEIHPDTKIIHTRVFADSHDLQSLSIPENLKTIGVGAFSGCEKLTDISLPDGLVRIEESALASCRSLESVILPDSINYIGDAAFADCYKLKHINIPTSLSTLNGYVFDCCIALESIHIPANLTEISFHEHDGYTPFRECGGLESITADPDNPVYHSDGNCLIESASGKLIKGCNNSVIPDNGSVTSIAPGAFLGCDKLKNIVIPQGVTLIGRSAFMDCKALQSVTLPVGLISIENSAFRKCSSLKNINIPDGLQIIDDGAFSMCTQLGDITLPASVTHVGHAAIFGNEQTVTVLNPTVKLEDTALYRASRIQGYENSTVHEYAKLHDIEFISLGAYIPPETAPPQTTVVDTEQPRSGCSSALSPIMCFAIVLPLTALAAKRQTYRLRRKTNISGSRR